MFGSSGPRVAAGLCGLFLLGASIAAAAVPAIGAGTVKDAAWARVLGETLFWDAVEAMSAMPGDSETSAASVPQVTQVLLSRHPLERYRWLIERAFDDSLWRGPDDSQLRANFALIWRLSTRLYESTLQSRPADLRVCTPDAAGDEFKCAEQTGPVRIIPIPSTGPALIPAHQPAIG